MSDEMDEYSEKCPEYPDNAVLSYFKMMRQVELIEDIEVGYILGELTADEAIAEVSALQPPEE